MASLELPPYIVQELPDISDVIKEPIKSTRRINYTCFDVSKKYIAFGATSGGVYVFDRSPCEFVQLIPSKEGPITRLCISPDEKFLSFANGQGIVTITNCEQSLNGSQNTVSSKEHKNNEVSAMIWGENVLFIGDDVGTVSILQINSFITKSIFQNSSQIIMNLDSRICQLDAKDCMLLISTFTRCYICDTSTEQYRQIGQKLRDGLYGACFVNSKLSEANISSSKNEVKSEINRYNIVDEGVSFGNSEKHFNTTIYCARPSSRLWEAKIDGTVLRTHQFKQVLANKPFKIVSLESYENEKIIINDINAERVAQSCTFPKLFNVNGAIFSFNRNSLYFLNVSDVEDTIWFETYYDIIDCSTYKDFVYIWKQNGSIVSLKYTNIEKFLIKSFFDNKYVICGELCALYKSYLLADKVNTTNLHILSGLREKLKENVELITKIDDVLDLFDKMKSTEATQMKSGIYILDNTYHIQSMMNNDQSEYNNESKRSTPESIQTLKDIGSAVTDTINFSKKIIKEKIVDIEEKVKNLSNDNESIVRNTKNNINGNKQSSQKDLSIDANSFNEGICKSIYQEYRLGFTSKGTNKINLVSIIQNYSCDIKKIHELMNSLKLYCDSIKAYDESDLVCNSIFLLYIEESKASESILDDIIKDEELYKYFVDSCITVNKKAQKLTNKSCECGFPLPYMRTKEVPDFGALIDKFIEKQWNSQTKDQCYELCKKMPYLWKKILYLRKNEDLMNILRLMLQMLDENLLHSFLPQFTVKTWDYVIQLYATLHGNVCLNCDQKFENICVKDTLSWDDLGSLLIKAVGGKTAVEVMQQHANLIGVGELTMKFYHCCLLAALFVKYDKLCIPQLVDAIYSVYESEEARNSICDLLRSAENGKLKNTALPIVVAANTEHWGLSPLCDFTYKTDSQVSVTSILVVSYKEVLENLITINNNFADCFLCGLPLLNEILIQDGGLWAFKCGHVYHGACLDVNKIKLCPCCKPSSKKS